MFGLDQSPRYACRSTSPPPPAPLPRSGFVQRPHCRHVGPLLDKTDALLIPFRLRLHDSGMCYGKNKQPRIEQLRIKSRGLKVLGTAGP